MGNVILHAFNWPFEEIRQKAKELKEIGYHGVLISPPSFSEGTAWYDRYQPVDYRIIYSPLGNLTHLKEMIHELKQSGLSIYVDIVFNHMASRPDEDLNFPGAHMLSRYENEILFKENHLFGELTENLFSEDDFNPKACIDPSDYNDPQKTEDVQNDRICDERVASGLPDLKSESPRVVNMQRDYLTALKSLGVDGFRIDAAKHMPIEHIQRVFAPEIVDGLYVFGEIIPAEHGHFVNEFMQESSFAAYDFPLFYSLHSALQPEGGFDSLADPNDLDTFRSLTFAVTHDIPNNESMRIFIIHAADEQRTDETLAYAYILGRDGGVPLVYSDKGEEDGLYTNLWKDAYNKPVMKKMIFFHNALFGKKMNILAAGKCHLIINREGEGIVAINKCAESQTVEVSTDNIRGSFKNILADDSITVEGDRFVFTIPPRTCSLYLKQDVADEPGAA